MMKTAVFECNVTSVCDNHIDDVNRIFLYQNRENLEHESRYERKQSLRANFSLEIEKMSHKHAVICHVLLKIETQTSPKIFVF